MNDMDNADLPITMIGRRAAQYVSPKLGNSQFSSLSATSMF